MYRIMPYTLGLVLLMSGCVDQEAMERETLEKLEKEDEQVVEVDSTAQELRPGQSLIHLMDAEGLDRALGNQLVGALSEYADLRRLRPGTEMSFEYHDDELRSVHLPVNADSTVTVELSDPWITRVEVQPVKSERLAISGSVRSSMYQTLLGADAGVDLTAEDRRRLIDALADQIFAWKIDFSRNIQPGDHFWVIFDREVRPDGTARSLQVVAAKIEAGGVASRAFRHEDGSYYDEDGESLRAMFLRAPLEYRRISSAFSNNRLHPITGERRPHRGTDYAAPTGTPIRATADGTVQRAGWNGGYGNMVDIQHANGYVTRYAHMNAIQRGVQAGTRVRQGQTIGTVGMTGQATGPHLHYEVHRNGVAINPSGVEVQPLEPLSGDDLTAFREHTAHLRNNISQLAELNELNPGESVSQPIDVEVAAE